MSTFVTLMYHSLDDQSDNIYTISPGDFRQQVTWLISEGFVIEGFPGLEQRLKHNHFPERYVVMTFDDGYQSDLWAAEVLCAAGAQATFFLTRDFSQNRSGYLQRDDIRELASLCSIGSHGVSHAPLSRISKEQLHAELTESKAWLEAITGDPIRALSAPGGFMSRIVCKHAFQVGYTLLGNSVEWWNNLAVVKTERVVNRIAMFQGMPLRTLERIVLQKPDYIIKRRLRGTILRLGKHMMPLQTYNYIRDIFIQRRLQKQNTD